jgi:hypothetical protein
VDLADTVRNLGGWGICTGKEKQSRYFVYRMLLLVFVGNNISVYGIKNPSKLFLISQKILRSAWRPVYLVIGAFLHRSLRVLF